MFTAKWYTRASRVRIVIAKFDGRWKLPGGPYPIPELVALVAGILGTLFLLPRLGHPVLTGATGVCITAAAVTAMRRLPYSPVNVSTRIHRITRLYTRPISYSTDTNSSARQPVSTVGDRVAILDPASDRASLSAHAPHRAAGSLVANASSGTAEHLLGPEPGTAAALFT
jgi:hypothetical protein